MKAGHPGAASPWHAIVAMLVLGTGLIACNGSSNARVLGADDGRIRIPIPPGWQALAPNRSDWLDGTTVALLSNQALDPQCDEGGTGCRAPVAALGDGAMLLWWRTTNCAGSGCDLPDGERLLVGGRQAVRTGGTHLCDGLGATSEQVYLVSVSPQRVDAIIACQRDAASSAQAQLTGLLESVSWRTP